MRHHQAIGHGGVMHVLCAAALPPRLCKSLPCNAGSLNGQRPPTLFITTCIPSLWPRTFREFSAPILKPPLQASPSAAVLSGRCAADRLSTTSGTPRHLWPVIGARPRGRPCWGLKLVVAFGATIFGCFRFHVEASNLMSCCFPARRAERHGRAVC